ncbi:MAG TPA: histidine kinase dimerization/phospho-acceptor domain-containing protein, partial [Armatimonadota bacterium]|nr:histidine kinase dimerization/phospho-acceptor domain-containing protein [Armatimonadota bacterium]
MNEDLAQLVSSHQAAIREYWQAVIAVRMPQLPQAQQQAVNAILPRLLPAYAQLLNDGDIAPLDSLVRWLAPAGMLSRFTLEQLQEIAGFFHEAVWPLVALHAGGDIVRLLEAADAVTTACLKVTRAIAAEYQRRVLNEANETAEFGFTLADVTRSVSASLDLEEVLQSVCAEGARLMETEWAAVRLLEENDALVCHAAWGPGSEAMLGSMVALSDADALCSRAMRAGRTQTATARPGVSLDHPCLSAPQPRFFLAAPIIAKGELLGAMLFVDNMRQEHQALSRETERLLTAEMLVAQAALAIYNARLHDEEKRRQQAETDYHAQLQQKNTELEAFVYTASHDLRAPLIALHGLLGMLRMESGTVLNESSRQLMQRLDANVVQMERLINDLLEFSRAGRVTRQTTIEFDELVATLLEDWRLRLQERGIAVTVRSPLPVVYADRTALRQVLENLVGNAVKFM